MQRVVVCENSLNALTANQSGGGDREGDQGELWTVLMVVTVPFRFSPFALKPFRHHWTHWQWRLLKMSLEVSLHTLRQMVVQVVEGDALQLTFDVVVWDSGLTPVLA